MAGFLGALPLSAYGAGAQGWGGEVMNPMQPMNLQPLGVSAPSITAPAPAIGGWGGIQGLGMNIDTARLGLGGLQALSGLWSASQQNKLATKSFNYQKGILDTNLANSIKSYNLSVDDKFRSRAVVEGSSAADRDASIAKWSARDERRG